MSVTERLRNEQAAGTYTPTPSEPVGQVMLAAALLAGAFLLAIMVLGSALWAKPIVDRIRTDIGSEQTDYGMYDHPTAESEICGGTDYCPIGDTLYFAELVTGFGAVLLLAGLVLSVTAKSRWRPRLVAGAALIAALLAAPYVFFPDVLRAVAAITE